MLALYAFQLLPVNYAGVALMLLGLALMVAEAFVPSFGALGIGGVVAFVLGSLMLIDTDVPGFGLSIPLILTFAVTSAVLLVFVIGMAIQARRRPVVDGAEELMGARGLAVSGFPGPGSVRVHGEIWSAPQRDRHRRRSAGQRHRPGGPDPPGRARYHAGGLIMPYSSLCIPMHRRCPGPRGLRLQDPAGVRARGHLPARPLLEGRRGRGSILVIPVIQQMVKVDLRRDRHGRAAART